LQIYKTALKKGVSVILFLCGALCSSAQGVRMPVAADTTKSIGRLTLVDFPHPVSNFTHNATVIPVDLYAQHLPFFCRQELKMKDAHVPVSFRLGTVEQCDYLETSPHELRSFTGVNSKGEGEVE